MTDKKKKDAVPRRADGLETPDFTHMRVSETPVIYKPEPVDLDHLAKPYEKGIMATIGKNYAGYRIVWDKNDGFVKHHNYIPRTYPLSSLSRKPSVPSLSEIERFFGAVQEAAIKNPELANHLPDMQKSLDKMKRRTLTH